MIAKNIAARVTSISSIADSMLSARNVPTSIVTIRGTRRRSNLFVVSATAITTAKTRSGGAGSTRTNAKRNTPNATAAS